MLSNFCSSDTSAFATKDVTLLFCSLGMLGKVQLGEAVPSSDPVDVSFSKLLLLTTVSERTPFEVSGQNTMYREKRFSEH